ncbi:Transcription factor, variant 3 [Basidiobolus ranarum]|uniref:Transcription factor, variant 3 n=1 Tax=Basidiobolus ranarum TaxID=34480 RepID=A0ABR2X3N6_9FUNG
MSEYNFNPSFYQHQTQTPEMDSQNNYYAQTQSINSGSVPPEDNDNTDVTGTQESKDSKKKRAGPKRRKVTQACVYCRRSHMTCDDGRPCQRCIKRNIGHLCHNENKNNPPKTPASFNNIQQTPTPAAISPGLGNSSYKSLPLTVDQLTNMPSAPLSFASEHVGNEFSVISDFLESLNGAQASFSASGTPVNNTEKFFLTAADPSDGTFEDRLTEIISAKFEAGLLKPYNYVKGYERLQRYMDSHMSYVSKQRIIGVMGTFRPAFRAIAQSLTDIDLVLVEEAFERLLLDYDRVFSSMGIPACLWRRTGEIYKGNKEFAYLVGIPIEMLCEGKLCIYELMTEESAVNYWEVSDYISIIVLHSGC